MSGKMVFLAVAAVLTRTVHSDVDSTTESTPTPATTHTTLTPPADNSSSSSPVIITETSDIILKLISHRCHKQYSVTCFKLDMMRLVDRLGHTPSYQLLPGVKLTHLYLEPAPVKDMPFTILQAVLQGNDSTELDDLLVKRINNYLDSITLSVKLLDQHTVSRAKKIGQDILDGFTGDVQTGRKKGYGGALWAAGTLAAVGVAGLAAMAGKALMTSMLALLLAAGGALRGSGGAAAGGGGGGGEKCAYHYMTAHGRNMELHEIGHKPVEVAPASSYRIYDREP
ncbi:uncharacterized protein LOC120355461 [Nilaparvata lugens]|uniref:uncharacterized protein LOC120355461 n=1 Tax=Nilaparvata lugens TaxID=108931 RepID=UPI00193CBDA2|nr:uncharacterized protein LOC120355461 [Nilaparvata lugens]